MHELGALASYFLNILFVFTVYVGSFFRAGSVLLLDVK
jgi:hypothetical protein